MINADTSFEKIFLTKDEHSARTLVFVHRRAEKNAHDIWKLCIETTRVARNKYYIKSL